MNLHELLNRQALILDEDFNSPIRWTVGERINAFNDAAIRMNTDLGVLVEVATDSTVANQSDYSFPRGQDGFQDATQDFRHVLYSPGVSHIELQPLNEGEMYRMFPITGTPSYYTPLWSDHKIKIYPAPTASATNTTTTATATATATSIALTSVSGFPTAGRIKNTTTGEVMGYTGITTLTLTGLTRGLEGTTAVAVGLADVITIRDLQYRLVVQPQKFYRYYNTGLVSVANNSTGVTGSNTNWTNNIQVGDLFGTGIKYASMPEVYYTIKTVSTSTWCILDKPWADATISTPQAYGMGQTSPFHEDYDDGLLFLSLHFLLAKDDDPKAMMYWNKYQEFAGARGGEDIPEDYVPVMGRGRRTGRTSPTLGPWYPET